jgi:hypothetical protein
MYKMTLKSAKQGCIVECRKFRKRPMKKLVHLMVPSLAVSCHEQIKTKRPKQSKTKPQKVAFQPKVDGSAICKNTSDDSSPSYVLLYIQESAAEELLTERPLCWCCFCQHITHSLDSRRLLSIDKGPQLIC